MIAHRKIKDAIEEVTHKSKVIIVTKAAKLSIKDKKTGTWLPARTIKGIEKGQFVFWGEENE